MENKHHAHGARRLTRLLGLGQIVVGAASLGALLWMAISFPVWWADAPRLPLPVEVAVQPAQDLLAANSTGNPFRSWDTARVAGEFEVEFVNPWAQWLYLLFALQEFVLAFLILHFLRRIVGSISRGEALSTANATRLRWIGFLMIIERAFAPGASVLVSKAALQGLDFTGGNLSVMWFRDFGWGGFMAAWVVVVLSEVFRQGAELKREQSLTI